MLVLRSPLLQSAGRAVLGSDPAQRLRIGRSLLAAAVYAALMVLLQAAVRLGLVDPAEARAATLCIAVGPVVFFVLLRSGLNLRAREPALTFAQMLFAVVAIGLVYAIASPVRAALLLVLMTIMAFGMFSLTPQEARRLTNLTICGFAIAMTALASKRPLVNDWRIESIHGLMLVGLLFTVGRLSSQFARLRLRLREQRSELGDALTRLETLVRRDALTGLVNRRCMGELLAAEDRRRARDPAAATCLCVIDLDHFKRVNDRLGHAAGDAVLRRFASVAQSCLRSVDVLARWGGEEFLLLLPGTESTEALTLLERIRGALAAASTAPDAPGWRVTFSAGVTDWRPGEPPEPAIERADRAAYAAKARGRDGWCVG